MMGTATDNFKELGRITTTYDTTAERMRMKEER